MPGRASEPRILDRRRQGSWARGRTAPRSPTSTVDYHQQVLRYFARRTVRPRDRVRPHGRDVRGAVRPHRRVPRHDRGAGPRLDVDGRPPPALPLARARRRRAAQPRAPRRRRRDLGPDEYERIEDLADLQRVRPQLADALDRLCADQRTALTLRVLEHRGYDEIALACGASEQAVRARVSRGLRELGKSLAANSGHDRPKPTTPPSTIDACPRRPTTGAGGLGAGQGRGAGPRGAEARPRRAGAAGARRRRSRAAGRARRRRRGRPPAQRGLVRAIDADPARVLITPAGRRSAGAATLPPAGRPTPDGAPLRLPAPGGTGRGPAARRRRAGLRLPPQAAPQGHDGPAASTATAPAGSSRATGAVPARAGPAAAARCASAAAATAASAGAITTEIAELRPRLVPAPRAPPRAGSGRRALDARHRRPARDGRGLWMTVGPTGTARSEGAPSARRSTRPSARRGRRRSSRPAAARAGRAAGRRRARRPRHRRARLASRRRAEPDGGPQGRPERRGLVGRRDRPRGLQRRPRRRAVLAVLAVPLASCTSPGTAATASGCRPWQKPTCSCSSASTSSVLRARRAVAARMALRAAGADRLRALRALPRDRLVSTGWPLEHLQEALSAETLHRLTCAAGEPLLASRCPSPRSRPSRRPDA